MWSGGCEGPWALCVQLIACIRKGKKGTLPAQMGSHTAPCVTSGKDASKWNQTFYKGLPLQ